MTARGPAQHPNDTQPAARGAARAAARATSPDFRTADMPAPGRPTSLSHGLAATLRLALLGLLTVAAAGCSGEKRHKVLSFFFDGVPDPNAPVATVGPDGEPLVAAPAGAGGARSVVSRHKPFVEEKCNACHPSDKTGIGIGAGAGVASSEDKLFNVDAKACLTCHKDVETKYAVVHGPVTAGACSWCHAPHESALPALLRAPAPAVCLQCHDREVLSTGTQAHRDTVRDCLDCHMAHGGPDRRLLRAALPPGTLTPPATRPVAGAAAAVGGGS